MNKPCIVHFRVFFRREEEKEEKDHERPPPASQCGKRKAETQTIL
jgi:hypothetical protein